MGESRMEIRSSPEWRSWSGMLNRCKNPSARCYNRYGGRGIIVCERWQDSFENFLADMGRKPTPRHSLDRIDNDGNYEPSNCRWATPSEQQRNRADNRIVQVDGIKMLLVDACERYGIRDYVARTRLDALGWTEEDTFKRAVGKYTKANEARAS